jgi:hypothetical protein
MMLSLTDGQMLMLIQASRLEALTSNSGQLQIVADTAMGMEPRKVHLP